MKSYRILQILLAMLLPGAVHAAEGAAGLYILGSQGPMAGFLPPPGAYARHDDYFYHGQAGTAPFSGHVVVDVDASFFLDFTTLTLVTPYKILGANYAFAAVLPAGKVSMNAEAVINPLNLSFSGSQSDSGFSEMIIYPIILGWHFEQVHVMSSVGVFLPTGSYSRRRVANIAKNHYAVDSGVGVTWLEPFLGLEVSNWTGLTINAKNKAIDYRTGNEFHSECFIGKTFDKVLQIGVVSYLYNQLTGDSGRGAVLGPFEGHVIGVGPLLLYNFKIGKVPVSINARYYKEFDVVNRFKGNAFFATFSFPFFEL